SLPLFFLILRPPPRTALFPYTTLFRSGRGPCRRQAGERRREGQADRVREQIELPNEVASELAGTHDEIMKTLETHLDCDVFPRGDRKSTRLNSSHSQISYAVFCLKKKK